MSYFYYPLPYPYINSHQPMPTYSEKNLQIFLPSYNPHLYGNNDFSWSKKVESTTNLSFSQQIPSPIQIPEIPVNQIKNDPKIRRKRKRNQQKEIQSAKKNSQSNIINQLYSFYSSQQKSDKIVVSAIKKLQKEEKDREKIKNVFYNIIRLINFKRGRKYVNKDSILNFYTPEKFKSEIPQIVEKLQEAGFLTIEQLSFIFRICTFNFLKQFSQVAILTSKRISSVAKKEHLKRRKRVLQLIRESND